MLTATVHWFDAASGEGVVICDQTGEELYLHYSCILGIDRNGCAYPTAADQQRLRDIAGRQGQESYNTARMPQARAQIRQGQRQ